MILFEKSYENFKVEVVDIHSSRVDFIEGPVNPLGTIGVVTRGYTGIYSEAGLAKADLEKVLSDLNRTKLKTPLEMVSFVFLLREVSRAFTHQLVRTRVGASFVQESMRFLGHKGVYTILATGKIVRNKQAMLLYCDHVSESINVYEKLLGMGIPSEDARGVLPTNVMTAVFLGVSLSTLNRMYEQRMCCQAQPGEWQIVLKGIKSTLREIYADDVDKFLSAPYERGEPCGYRASFDRPCTWQKEAKDDLSSV